AEAHVAAFAPDGYSQNPRLRRAVDLQVEPWHAPDCVQPGRGQAADLQGAQFLRSLRHCCLHGPNKQPNNIFEIGWYWMMLLEATTNFLKSANVPGRERVIAPVVRCRRTPSPPG